MAKKIQNFLESQEISFLILSRKFYLTGGMVNLQVRWNDHLINYLSPMYRYEINANLLLLTFFRAIF